MFTTAQVLAAEAGYRRLPVAEFRDKMQGAWLGQMIGVGWGAPSGLCNGKPPYSLKTHCDG